MAILNKLTLIVSAVTKIGPGLKAWIFADGKFSLNRSIILLVALALLIGSVYFVGVDTTHDAIELLDDVSDIIGYAGG